MELSTELEQLIEKKIQQALLEREKKKTTRMAIIATQGTLDGAYPPFILASTAAALGWEVKIFFTFYGLSLIQKDISNLKISPLGNPAMPMKMPFGPDWFKEVDWKIPNIVQANIPGFESMATSLMKQTIATKGVASLDELRTICLESGVKFVACQMAVNLLGFKNEDFLEGTEHAGAASFLPFAKEAAVSLYI